MNILVPLLKREDILFDHKIEAIALVQNAPFPGRAKHLNNRIQPKPKRLPWKGGSVVYQDGDNPLSYEHLEGDWGLFYKIAKYFVHKVRFEDRGDFLHDLMIKMAEVKAKYEAKGKPLTEAGLMRVASYELSAYWEKHKLPTIVVDCGNCSKEQRQKCRKEDFKSLSSSNS